VTALCVVAAALCVPAASLTKTPPKLQKSIGKGEGALSLLVLPGYAEKAWVTPFQRQTGCKVDIKYASAFDDMTSLMQGGGTGVDLVTAAGDVGLQLVDDGDITPVNVALVPGWKSFGATFKSPGTNTVGTTHYGISSQFSPNLLVYNAARLARPASWAAVYSARHRGKVSMPDDPMAIADAALYLAKARPGLGIKDPFELTDAQFATVVQLLKTQRPLVAEYWATASDEIALFKNGGATLGSGWPYQLAALQKAHVRVKATVPREGVTAWLDSWMLSKKAAHPNCAYRWLDYVSTAKVQAQIADFYGAAPVNVDACRLMAKNNCAVYRAGEPAAYYRRLRFWKTPLSDCGVKGGTRKCVPYARWSQAWGDIKG